MRRVLLAFVAALLALVGLVSPAAAARPVSVVGAATYAYDSPVYDAPATASDRGSQVVGSTDTTDNGSVTVVQVTRTAGATLEPFWGLRVGLALLTTDGVAANGGERLLWTSWQNYPKVTQGGREYAQIGDRLYSHHAVDRLQPSGLGAPAGATGAGRSVSPNFVEDVLGSTKGVPVKGPNGEARLSFTSGTVQVITEDSIVITVITR